MEEGVWIKEFEKKPEHSRWGVSFLWHMNNIYIMDNHLAALCAGHSTSSEIRISVFFILMPIMMHLVLAPGAAIRTRRFYVICLGSSSPNLRHLRVAATNLLVHGLWCTMTISFGS